MLLNEIFLPILEMRHSTVRQKSIILGVFIRLCQDPQALVEIYINYDCDRAALENIYERLMNIVSKIGQTHFAPPTKEELGQSGPSRQGLGSGNGPTIPSSLSTSALGGGAGSDGAQYAGLAPEVKLRRQSLECLVAALKSLVAWSVTTSTAKAGPEDSVRVSEDGLGRHHASNSTGGSNVELVPPSASWPMDRAARTSISGLNTPELGADDVGRFESAKQRKTTLQEGIKKFNFKPKRGIEYLVQHGFIRTRTPTDVARFLLGNDGLSKAMIGEYLGEG